MKKRVNKIPSIAEYFDSIAEKWDLWEGDLNILNQKLKEGLKSFELKKNEWILDVGCGTGNLTKAILEFLSDEGKIVAVDFSKKMIEIAKKKIFDKRVKWFCGDIEWIQLKNSTFDRIICYSVWPHFQNHLSIVKRFYNILKKDGKIHIWHLKSKEEINEIHSKAHPLIMSHLLRPAEETAQLLRENGFYIEEIYDNEKGYLVSGRKK